MKFFVILNFIGVCPLLAATLTCSTSPSSDEVLIITSYFYSGGANPGPHVLTSRERVFSGDTLFGENKGFGQGGNDLTTVTIDFDESTEKSILREKRGNILIAIYTINVHVKKLYIGRGISANVTCTSMSPAIPAP